MACSIRFIQVPFFYKTGDPSEWLHKQGDNSLAAISAPHGLP